MLKKFLKRILPVETTEVEEVSCPLHFDQRSRRRMMWGGRLGRSR